MKEIIVKHMIKNQSKIDSIITILGIVYLNYCILMIFEYKILEYTAFFLRGILFYKLFFYVINLKKKFLFIYFFLLIYYLIYGILKMNFIGFLVLDLLSSLSIIFLFFLNHDNRKYITEKLIKMISFLLLISSLCSLLYLSKYGFRAAETVGERFTFEEEGSYFKLILQTQQLAILVLPFIWFIKLNRKIILISSVLLFIIFSFVSLSRAAIAVSIISILLTIFIGFKLEKIKFRYSLMSDFSLLTLCAVFFINKNKEILTISYDLLKMRFELIGDELEPRDVEAEYYFKDLSNYELFLGKGMGAANLRPFGNYSERGIMMMHRGENNLILKGGLLLLIIFYGLAFFSFIKLFLAKDLYSASWASVILIYLILERGHQQFNSVFMLIFFCMAISYAYSLNNKKSNKYG